MMNILIIGASGQDGKILMRECKEKNISYLGVARDFNAESNESFNTATIDFTRECWMEVLSSNDFTHYIFLAAMSSVRSSFKAEKETIIDNQKILLDFLSTLVSSNQENLDNKWLFYAMSSECIPQGSGDGINIKNRNYSPYAVSKNNCYNILDYYEERYNIKVSKGYLFNHESIYRGEEFLFPKIIRCAFESKESGKCHEFGNIEIRRDWSCAFEVCRLILWLAEHDVVGDVQIGSGKNVSIKELLTHAYKAYELAYYDFVTTSGTSASYKEDLTKVADVTLLETLHAPVPKKSAYEILDDLRKYKYEQNKSKL